MEIGSVSANKNLIVILLIILTIAGVVAFTIYVQRPFNEKIAGKEKILEKKKQDVRQIELTKRLLAETKGEIERLKSDIVRIEKFFPEEVFIPRVLVLVENLAMATHLEIGSFRPSKGVVKAPTQAAGAARPAPVAQPQGAAGAKPKMLFDQAKEYKTTNIEFKVKGTFQNIYNFMNELSTFPKLVVVDRLLLSPSTSGKEEGKEGEVSAAETGREVETGGYMELSVDMPLTFYVQKQESPSLQF